MQMRADERADRRVTDRLVQGSVRAWRDDLYRDEELVGEAIAARRWTPDRGPRMASVKDVKEVSRAASWETWRHLATARHALDRQYRLWRTPRHLTDDEAGQLMGVLAEVERARLMLARELDEGDREPLAHPVLRMPELQALRARSP